MNARMLVVVDSSRAVPASSQLFDAAKSVALSCDSNTECALVALSTTTASGVGSTYPPIEVLSASQSWGPGHAVVSKLDALQKQGNLQEDEDADWTDFLGSLLDGVESTVDLVLIGLEDSFLWQPDNYLGLWLGHRMRTINNGDRRMGIVVHAVSASGQAFPAPDRSGVIEAFVSECTHVRLYDSVNRFITQFGQRHTLWCGTLVAGMDGSNGNNATDGNRKQARHCVGETGFIISSFPCRTASTTNTELTATTETKRRKSPRTRRSHLKPSNTTSPEEETRIQNKPHWLLHRWGTIHVLHAASKAQIGDLQHLMGHELGELRCQDPLVYPRASQFIADLCHTASSDCALICALEQSPDCGGENLDCAIISQLIVLFVHQTHVLVRRVLHASELEGLCRTILDAAALPNITLELPSRACVDKMKAKLQALDDNKVESNQSDNDEGYDTLCASETNPLCAAPTQLRSVPCMESALLQSSTLPTKGTERDRGKRCSTTAATALDVSQEARQRRGPVSQLVRLLDQEVTASNETISLNPAKRRKAGGAQSWRKLREEFARGEMHQSSPTIPPAGVEYASFHKRASDVALQSVTKDIETNRSLLDPQDAIVTLFGRISERNNKNAGSSRRVLAGKTGVSRSDISRSSIGNSSKVIEGARERSTMVSSRSKRATLLAQHAPTGSAGMVKQQLSHRFNPYASKRSRALGGHRNLAQQLDRGGGTGARSGIAAGTAATPSVGSVVVRPTNSQSSLKKRIKAELVRTLPQHVVGDPQRLRSLVQSATTVVSAFLQMAPGVATNEVKLAAKVKSTCAFVVKESLSLEDLLGGGSSDEG
jgi:hypothetical protein